MNIFFIFHSPKTEMITKCGLLMLVSLLTKAVALHECRLPFTGFLSLFLIFHSFWDNRLSQVCIASQFLGHVFFPFIFTVFLAFLAREAGTSRMSTEAEVGRERFYPQKKGTSLGGGSGPPGTKFGLLLRGR